MFTTDFYTLPFTQSIQSYAVVLVGTHSDVVSPSQVVTTKAHVYTDFQLPDAMNSKIGSSYVCSIYHENLR